MYKIGVISDTHGLLRQNAIDVLTACRAILHGGDIQTPEILEQLKEIAPLYAVRGNTDRGDWAVSLPETQSFELFGIKFFMIHNKNQIQQDICDRDIVIFGHSHKYVNVQKAGQTWLNPGSCGPRRFTLPVTMAVITADENSCWQIERIDLAPPSASGADHDARKDMRTIVLRVMRDTDRGKPVQTIAERNRISEDLAAQICRLYLTHPGVTADGILKKMGMY